MKKFKAYFRWRDTSGQLCDRFIVFEAKSRAEAVRLAKAYAAEHRLTYCGIDAIKSNQ